MRTNKRAAPSPKGATNTTNTGNNITRAAQFASPGRRVDRRGWRPVRIGELIEAAMGDLLQRRVAP